MAFEWVAGLFQGDNQQTRGLSGDSAHTVALDGVVCTARTSAQAI